MMLYFSFDEEAVTIEEVIVEFQSRIGVDIFEAGRIFIFLDEIQKLAGWQNQVKYYYDTHPNLKFFISGSFIMDYDSLSNDLGISRKTLSKYISYLEMGFLIQKCLQLLKSSV